MIESKPDFSPIDPIDATYSYINTKLSTINGQKTGITDVSDIVERGTMDMAGIKNISVDYPPVTMNGAVGGDVVPGSTKIVQQGQGFSLSTVEFEDANLQFQIGGMKPEDLKQYVDYLNHTYGEGTVTNLQHNQKINGIGDHLDTFEIHPSVMVNKILPDLHKHLEEKIARDNPEMIRDFQRQSEVPENFVGPKESKHSSCQESLSAVSETLRNCGVSGGHEANSVCAPSGCGTSRSVNIGR